MKAYTDIEQSKKLAEILPLESADMFYNEEQDETYPKDIVNTKYPMVIREGQKYHLEEYGIPCWSFVALLEVLPPRIPGMGKLELSRFYVSKGWYITYSNAGKDYYIVNSNPIDACVEMIHKLKEKDLL